MVINKSWLVAKKYVFDSVDRIRDAAGEYAYWGGLDLAIFRVLGVRQNSHINK